MKCDLCENEATVHEWTKVGGQRHLCESCAKQAGLPVQSQAPFSQIVASLLKHAAENEAAEAAAGGETEVEEKAGKPLGACAACGLELAQFRSTGLLGCPECYHAFESVLGPLIERAHEGATHHTGKVPRALDKGGRPAAGESAYADLGREERARAARRAEREKRAAALRAQLADAVAAEQYERAARLRDEVAGVERELGEQESEAAPRDRGRSEDPTGPGWDTEEGG
ncbi:MAG: UvrB/UvrC motif-containing protein [Phycisphaerales bacterium]